MIDLTTSYMGLTLKNPLVCSSSPLGQDLNALCQMEAAGAAAVVLHSLFEEQIHLEGENLDRVLDHGTESFPEALSYFPDMADYNLGPEGYLEHIREAKRRICAHCAERAGNAGRRALRSEETGRRRSRGGARPRLLATGFHFRPRCCRGQRAHPPGQ